MAAKHINIQGEKNITSSISLKPCRRSLDKPPRSSNSTTQEKLSNWWMFQLRIIKIYSRRCLPKGYILNVLVQYACVLPPRSQTMLSWVTLRLPNWFSIFQVPVFWWKLFTASPLWQRRRQEGDWLLTEAVSKKLIFCFPWIQSVMGEKSKGTNLGNKI